MSARCEQLERKYGALRADVRVKLDFLDENRQKVMRKQVALLDALLRGLCLVPDSATPTPLDLTLRQFSVRRSTAATNAVNGAHSAPATPSAPQPPPPTS